MTMELKGEEFVRRFLLHVLPNGLMRIRHYGFLANRYRDQKLKVIRECLNRPPGEPDTATAKEETAAPINYNSRCPKCHQDTLRLCYEILPRRLTEG